MDLLRPPEPLTSRQKQIAWSLAVVCALARFAARAHSLWEWDEALLCLGMRSYDVTQHHPHPPGFPAFIALGHLARLLTHDDFRALQLVNLLAGMLLFPAMLLLGRELRLRFDVAVLAAGLCAFFPNVWFFGGTAFSDVVSLVLVVFAIALLLRGCRDRWAYLLGTFLLAVAIGIRPQNFLIGLWPGLVATRHRARAALRDVALALLIGVVVTGAAFGGAMLASASVEGYLSAVRVHARYISEIDSYRSATRPALWRVFERFFVKQYQSTPLSIVTTLFVLISAVGSSRDRDRRIGMMSLAFAPFAISAWLMLDRFSISRFSIGYAPLFAVLAADGVARVSGQRVKIGAAVGGVLVVSFIVYSWPALRVVRNEIAPSVAAVRAISDRLDPVRDDLFVAFAMRPFVDYLAPAQRWTGVLDERAVPLSIDGRQPWLLAEIDHTNPSGYVFHRRRNALWNISRRHFFDTALEPVTNVAQFVSGWYRGDRDQAGHREERWMAGHSRTILQPGSGRWILRLDYQIADELMPLHPTVTITLNGAQVDRLQPAEAAQQHDYEVSPAPNHAPNVLELDIDHTFNATREHQGDDARDLGLRVHTLSWGPR